MNKDALYTFAFVIYFLTFALMLDLKFIDIFILNNYVQIQKTTIATTRNDLKILIPLLCSIYHKIHPFAKTYIKF